MKTLTLKLTNLFSFENMLLKTRQLFLRYKSKPVATEAKPPVIKAKPVAIELQHTKTEIIPAVTEAQPAEKTSAESDNFQSLSFFALIQIAKNIILCSFGSAYYTQTNSTVTLLSHSVTCLEDALMLHKIKNDAATSKALKFHRIMVLRHLTEVSRIAKATALLHPENEALIISASGFGIK